MDESRPRNLAVTRIRARTGWEALNLREMWGRRELLWFLALRDIRVRYKQTILGVGWAVLQPFMQMVVFSVIFGEFLKVPTDNDIAYTPFSSAATVPWSLFSAVLGSTATSLTANAGILSKVYFPRLLIPLAGAGARLVDFTVAFVILLGLILAFGFGLTAKLLLIPAFLLLLLVTALGFGLWLGAINVYIRDIQMLVPFLVSLWQYASPVIYSSQSIPESWRNVYALNPMAGVLAGFRWCLLGTTPPGPEIWVSSGVALAVFLSGVMMFLRVQRTMVDIL
ncbi:MAG: ABC transporter permease [Anaerolineales bacterium]|nr:ABC transporter permease [Anaerolineales bacterium]